MGTHEDLPFSLFLLFLSNRAREHKCMNNMTFVILEVLTSIGREGIHKSYGDVCMVMTEVSHDLL